MARKKKGPDEEPPKPEGDPRGPEPRAGAGPKPKKAEASARPKPGAKPKAKAKGKAKGKAGPGSGPKRAAKPRAAEARREAEGLIQQVMGLISAGPSGPGQARAEDLMLRAYDADDPAEAAALARQALEAWPDCADAYVLLAEQARGPKEALDLYAQAVEAGARDIGPEAFREHVGHFWLWTGTRPYMRARFGMAQVLWVLGRWDEAIGHYEDMLRLNPNDNQGVRYVLAAGLVEAGRDRELAELLARYDGDNSANWAYTSALLAFRREGDSPSARDLVAQARRVNPYVPDLLTGRERLPARMPETITPGGPDEAVDYVAGFLRGWRGTPGALAWLRRVTAPARGRGGRAGGPRPKGPTAASKTRVKKVPMRDDAVWQAEARKMPVWVESGGEMRRPWVVLVASRSDDLILAQALLQEPPTPALLWDTLAKAMTQPAAGPPHRPAEVQARPGGPWDEIATDLDAVGVRLAHEEPLELMEGLMDDLTETVFGAPGGPALLDMPGVAPEHVAGFYRAAAGFYRAAPWQRVAGDETIKIECDRYESGPWYAVVIGQMGMTLGLALYEDLAALVRMREGDASDEQNARETVALSVTFGDETETPVLDVDAAERFGWEVASPEAYPAPMRKERGLVMRPPLGWELRLLEACLRAVPGFVSGHDRDDPSRAAHEVPTASGPLTLALSWVKD